MGERAPRAVGRGRDICEMTRNGARVVALRFRRSHSLARMRPHRMGRSPNPAYRTFAAAASASSVPATRRVSDSFSFESGLGMGIISSRRTSWTATMEIP
jgi:hypothetical protein